MTQNGPPKKDSEFLPNSAIETQKTQKLGVFAEILPPLEALIHVYMNKHLIFIFTFSLFLLRSCCLTPTIGDPITLTPQAFEAS